ncbi:MAG TPA: GNAT family N-acetyltransferase [Halanaerobiales bacterium]|nr:GNAT family N-acetyltransferase [Halanaerobiales bacterium]
MNDDFNIRFAQRKDTELVLKFIKELADYEELLDEVIADEETLEESLFDREMAEVIIAEYKDKPVGFALFFHNFSTFLGKPGIYLEDLYVKPEYRGNGFGKKLLAFLADLTVKRDCGRLEWWVLDWNKSSIDFYESLGAKAMDEWTVYRLTGKSLQELAGDFKS